MIGTEYSHESTCDDVKCEALTTKLQVVTLPIAFIKGDVIRY